MDWQPIETAPEGELVETKIDDARLAAEQDELRERCERAEAIVEAVRRERKLKAETDARAKYGGETCWTDIAYWNQKATVDELLAARAK